MKNKKYKAKKMAGLIVGLSLAQAGGIILPGMDVLSVVQAAEQEVSSEELAQAVAETVAGTVAGTTAGITAQVGEKQS